MMIMNNYVNNNVKHQAHTHKLHTTTHNRETSCVKLPLIPIPWKSEYYRFAQRLNNICQ